jgi:hypothetical protein
MNLRFHLVSIHAGYTIDITMLLLAYVYHYTEPGIQ